MTLRKAVFSVTCGAGGHGEDDVRLSGKPASRGAQLMMVSIDRVEVFGGRGTVTISELRDVSTESWNDTDEVTELGKQLFHVDFADFGRLDEVGNEQAVEFDPRHNITDMFGRLPTFDVRIGTELITTAQLRCEVDGGDEGDIYAVTLFYETAGDYRF